LALKRSCTLGWLLVFQFFIWQLGGCSNTIPQNFIADGVPSFISSTLVNATYLGGISRSKTARYIDGQEGVHVPGQLGVTGTFYNFGFWEGDDIQLPQEKIDSMWHNNDYSTNILYATKKWIAEYSLYYLPDGTAYSECRYKLRVKAPLNGIYYCYSEIIYIGSIDIATFLQNSPTTSTSLDFNNPPVYSSGIIGTTIKDGKIVGIGSTGDFIVKVKENNYLLAMASRPKDSMFVSIDPFPFIEDEYILVNVVPQFAEYRILDPNIKAPENGKYYSVCIHFSSDS
jgi:hypothetical protein